MAKNYLSNVDIDTTKDILIMDSEAREYIGDLTKLKTKNKSNLVNSINSLYDNRDKLELTFMQDYLDLGQTPTVALQNAINDCSAKGTVIIPRGQRLEIVAPIIISKPIAIRGLDHGFNELDGGNNVTPYNDYISASLRFTAGLIGFHIKSPSVEISNLVIEVLVPKNFIAFKLDSETGDSLNMPRNIRLENIFCWNLRLGSYTNTTYGVYSEQPVLLSSFKRVLFGWFTYGFAFENSSINTSLCFDECRVTAQKWGFHINKGEYCTFINSSIESPCDTAGFYFDDCVNTTMIGCFCEQIAAPNIIANSCTATTIDGFFCTTLPIVSAFLGTMSLNGAHCAISGTSDNPEIVLNGCNVQMSGCRFEYVKQGNTISRPMLNNKVLNINGNFATVGVTVSGATCNTSWVTQYDKRVHIGGIFDTTGTSFNIVVPSALLSNSTTIISGGNNCWGIIQPFTATIGINTPSAGSYALDFEYEAIASF